MIPQGVLHNLKRISHPRILPKRTPGRDGLGAVWVDFWVSPGLYFQVVPLIGVMKDDDFGALEGRRMSNTTICVAHVAANPWPSWGPRVADFRGSKISKSNKPPGNVWG